jgi:hypothetical protein
MHRCITYVVDAGDIWRFVEVLGRARAGCYQVSISKRQKEQVAEPFFGGRLLSVAMHEFVTSLGTKARSIGAPSAECEAKGWWI